MSSAAVFSPACWPIDGQAGLADGRLHGTMDVCGIVPGAYLFIRRLYSLIR